MPSAAGLSGATILATPVREVVEPLAAQAAAGKLKVDVEHVLPFDQAHEGLATLAAGNARGKIVVTSRTDGDAAGLRPAEAGLRRHT